MDNNLVKIVNGQQYCPNCNNELDDEYFVEWNYCAHCGSKLIYNNDTVTKVRWKLILLAVYKLYIKIVWWAYFIYMISIGNSIFMNYLFNHDIAIDDNLVESVKWFWQLAIIVNIYFVYYTIKVIKLGINKLRNYIKKKRG